MSEQLLPMPDPIAYCYEWDGPVGTRKFSSNFWNGREADRAVAIFSADQMKAYARAAVEANHSPASMQLIAELVELLEFCVEDSRAAIHDHIAKYGNAYRASQLAEMQQYVERATAVIAKHRVSNNA